jgi:hypothetical protein
MAEHKSEIEVLPDHTVAQETSFHISHLSSYLSLQSRI